METFYIFFESAILFIDTKRFEKLCNSDNHGILGFQDVCCIIA